VYDDVTGTVFPVTPITQALIEAHADTPLDRAIGRFASSDGDIEQAVRFVRHWTTHYGAFYREPVQIALAPRPTIQECLDDLGYRQLVLTLTEDCNLRCAYCAFSPVYPDMRSRTRATMPLEVGRQAIDYFLSKVARQCGRNPWRVAGIGFYGGEPLLAQRTLTELVGYARDRAPCPIVFSVTTNGTLLRDDIADFLVAHDVRILVSVDGARDDHDRNRVFATGQGSFDTVMARLRRFRERHPDYAAIRLLSVIDWTTDLGALATFLDDAYRSLHLKTRVSYVRAAGGHYYDRFTEAQRDKWRVHQRAMIASYIDRRSRGEPIDRLQEALVEDRLLSLLTRPGANDRRPDILPETGTCVPGSKLGVRTDGTFDICERVNGSRPIGHVSRGIDECELTSVIEEYNGHCAGCWACPIGKLCGQCFVSFEQPERHVARSEALCAELRQQTRDLFRVLYTVLERNPSAFTNSIPPEDAGITAALR
jgi:uncharacterized protein